MLVHLVKAVEHRAEILRADGQHRRKADGRIHRVTSADPVPEAEHVRRINAERGNLFGIGRDRHEMFRHRLGIAAESFEQPVARALRVGHRLQRGEGFGRNDEQRFRRIEIAGRLHEINAVHVRDEAERQAALAVMFERLVSHHRAEVRTADADVDDVLDAFAGVAFPFAAADALGERGHLVEHGVDFRHDIFSVHEDGRALRRAQGDVQHGAVFRDVDFLAAEHRVDPPAQPGFLGQLDQQLERFVGDAVLRVIQKQPGRLGGQALAAFRVIGWVAELARKITAVPGHPNHLWLQADPPATYLGVCSEFCGTQHAWMHFLVVAETPERSPPGRRRSWRRRKFPPPAARPRARAFSRT